MPTIRFTKEEGLPKELYKVKYDKVGNPYYETLTLFDTLDNAFQRKYAMYKAPNGDIYTFPLSPCLIPRYVN